MSCDRNICYSQDYNGGCTTCPCNEENKMELIEGRKHMRHTIEISTVDALLIVQLLHDNYLENETDRLIAEKLRNQIIENVAKKLSEQQVK